MFRYTIVFLLACILITGIATAETGTFTPDMARRLLQEGWEDIEENPGDPVIIYSLYFKQLNTEVINSFIGQISIQESADPSSTWSFTEDAGVMELIGASENGYTLNLQGINHREESTSTYNSWLSTVGYNPLNIEITTEVFGPKKETDLNLQIKIKPQYIDISERRVLTGLSLDFKNPSGAVVRIRTDNWLGEKAEQPVAVITQNIGSESKALHRYYGLYVLAGVINPDKFAGMGQSVIMGNIEDMNRLFSPPRILSEEKSKFVIVLGEDKFGLGLEKSGITCNLDSEILINKNNSDQLLYNISLGYPVFKKKSLLFAGQAGNRFSENNDTFIGLGLTDTVKWSDHLKARFSYYPASYNFREKKFSSSTGDLKIVSTYSGFSCWYQGIYLDNFLTHRAGIKYNFNSEINLITYLEKQGDSGHEWFIGMGFYH